MARLIDADAAKLTANDYVMFRCQLGGLVDVVEFLNDMPTVDAVPVVRCRDCKHYKPQKKSAHWENRANYCNRVVTIKVRPYDFCSYGERKDGDDE